MASRNSFQKNINKNKVDFKALEALNFFCEKLNSMIYRKIRLEDVTGISKQADVRTGMSCTHNLRWSMLVYIRIDEQKPC